MNWKRPTNVKRLLSAYATYPAITQVTVIMNNPTTRFNFTHPKVHTIVDHHHEKKLGLAVRFKYCTHAPTEWVLIVDDDILVTQEGLKALMEAKAADPQRLVGWHGRTWTTPVPEYNYKDAPPGPCHVLLTKTILADRANCKAFFKYAPLVAPYVHHYSKPLWNGEDIFLSYASYKEFGKQPLVVSQSKQYFQIWEDWQGMSAKVTTHIPQRNRFVKFAALALNIYPTTPE